MNRQALLTSTEVHEGFREKPYKDTLGLWTVGIGRCLETNPLTPEEYRHLLNSGDLALSINLTGSRWLAERQIDRIARELAAELSFWPGLSDTAHNVLVEMGYQMGVPKLLGFRQMLAYLSRHDYGAAAIEGLNSLWAKQTPSRARALMKRLEAA